MRGAWLKETSARGELLELSFTGLSIMRLYRAADVLVKHQAAIEAALFERVRDLFGCEATVTLYDLTNTYFEGLAAGNPKAKRGHSKEKRSDCPLLTLGLILDGSGFVRRSQVFAGNAVESRTLAGMLEKLSSRGPGAWEWASAPTARPAPPPGQCRAREVAGWPPPRPGSAPPWTRRWARRWHACKLVVVMGGGASRRS